MITGLRGASIWSEDLNNLLPFYRDVLGLEVGAHDKCLDSIDAAATTAVRLTTPRS